MVEEQSRRLQSGRLHSHHQIWICHGTHLFSKKKYGGALNVNIVKGTIWEATIWEATLPPPDLDLLEHSSGRLQSGRLQSGRLYCHDQIWICYCTHPFSKKGCRGPLNVNAVEEMYFEELTIWEATIWEATLPPPDLDMLLYSPVL